MLKKGILSHCTDLNKIFDNCYRLSDTFRSSFELAEGDYSDRREETIKDAANTSPNLQGLDDLIDEIDNHALYKIPVKHDLSSLILPEKDMEMLNAAIKRFRTGSFASLAEWGIVSPMDPDGQDKKGLFVLLYGLPGTGKTLGAGAIAKELGKELIAIDATQLRDKWYGNAEKYVRRLFQDMRQISLEAENPPIFLLNEADQLMHKRGSSEQSTDITENAIQNIILEEMESFPGILIMTTNLIDNFDAAYLRRINVKLEFTLPDRACRKRLWEHLLLPTIPKEEAIDPRYLARMFHFTGGQISLVIQNACNEAIMREGEFRKLTMRDLEKYAKLEQPWEAGPSSKRIGFRPLSPKHQAGKRDNTPTRG